MACRTVATEGTRARLVDDGRTVDRARVRSDAVTVAPTGRVAGHTIVLDLASGWRVRLRL